MTTNPAAGATLKLTLPGERPVSWNKFYAGMHWQERRRRKRDVHWAVKAALLELGQVEPFAEPVHITTTAFFKNRPMDSDNICDKLYIDALKHEGIIQDDCLPYLVGTTQVPKVDADYPRVVITITRA